MVYSKIYKFLCQMSFEKLTLQGLQRIRPLLLRKLPKSAMMLNIFDMALNGKYQDSQDIVLLYGYNGVPDTDDNGDNLFLISRFIIKEKDETYSIIYPPEHITDEMLGAFSNFQDWSTKHEYGAVPKQFGDLLEKLAREKGGCIKDKGCADDMYLPIESALKLDIERENLKEDFEVDRLSSEHAAKVNAHWRYGGGEARILRITDAIHRFGAIGVFKKLKIGKQGINTELTSPQNSVRDEEVLISWVIFMWLGTLNALYTLDEYRCKGIGRWTMEAASKFVATEMGLIPIVEIESYNQHSKRLMERIGYKLIQEVYWMMYVPSAPESP